LLFQPDGTPLNFHFAVRAFLDEELPRGWKDGAGPGTMVPWLVHLNFYFWVFNHRSCLHPVPSRLTDITGDTMVSPLFATTVVLKCVIMLTIISYHII